MNFAVERREAQKGTTMQITDEQFVQAIERAVMEKGPNNTSFGRYRNQDGAAECIVGCALAQIDMSIVPTNNQHLAYGLVKMYGGSDQVANAMHATQFLNDMHQPWGTCLKGFKLAMEPQYKGMRTPEVVQAIIGKIVGGRYFPIVVDEMVKADVDEFENYVAEVKPSLTWNDLVGSGFVGTALSASAIFPEVTVQKSGFTWGALPYGKKKKDHTLAA